MNRINLSEFKRLDEDSQIEYISDLEFEEEALFKWGLFNNILKDNTISDLTRIEILDVLSASDIPKVEREKFINIVLMYLSEREEDFTFLSHCIMALQNNDLFSEKVYSEMLKIFLNPTEDEDLRSNASVIIDNNTPKEKLKDIYKSFIDNNDPLFASNSEQWIKEIEQSED